MIGARPSAAPLSRPVRTAELSDRGMRIHVVADAAERAALARELDILSVERLEADVELSVLPKNVNRARLTGQMVADVVQACVVTLEPVTEQVIADIERNFALDAVDESEDEIEIEPDSEEPAEPVEGGTIDIGAAVAEQLALDLNPFPRAPGVAFEGYTEGEPEVEAAPNPFAALAALKRQEGDGQG